MSRQTAEILVVDDKRANLALLRDLLGPRGFRVRAFLSPEDALRSALERVPDLVLLDILMPEMSGYEWCRLFKAEEVAGDTPVIFVSGLGTATDKLKGFEVGGVDFLTKPYDFAELLARLDLHLKLARLKAEEQSRSERLAAALARLRALERSREEMARAIVHDLKNPAAAILMDAEFLQDSDVQAADAREVVQDLQDSARRMLSMLDDILMVARSQEEKLAVHPIPTDVAALVEEAAQACLRGSGAAGRDVSVECDPEVRGFALDASLIRRVVENLIGNALKYAKVGQVKLTASRAADGSLCLNVSDDGPGIPEFHREDIFAPFVRLAGEESRAERGGSGLGLPFCRLAVEAHGGSIRCEEASGGGAVFRVVIPESASLQPDALDSRRAALQGA